MYRKIVLLLAALALTVCSHLRPRLSLYVDGQRLTGAPPAIPTLCCAPRRVLR